MTWLAQETGTKEHLMALDFPNANNGWAVGWQGTIIHTQDGGKTWRPRNYSGIQKPRPPIMANAAFY